MNNEMNENMRAEIQDALSPHAVALIIAHLQCCSGDTAAHSEVAWFRDQLRNMIGSDCLDDLYDELGI